jgi:hypothetical protein
MIPPTTPILAYGNTTLRTTSQVVAPRSYADLSARRHQLEDVAHHRGINGITMIARMMPAVNMPIPIGGP